MQKYIVWLCSRVPKTKLIIANFTTARHILAEHDQAEAVEDFAQEHELSDEHHDSRDHAHETADESGLHGKLLSYIQNRNERGIIFI